MLKLCTEFYSRVLADPWLACLFLNKDVSHHAERLSCFFLERFHCGTPYTSLCGTNCGDGCGSKSCSPNSALNEAHRRGKSCPLRRSDDSSSESSKKRDCPDLPVEAGEFGGPFTDCQRRAWLKHMSKSMDALNLNADFKNLFNSYLAMAAYKYGPFAGNRKSKSQKCKKAHRHERRAFVESKKQESSRKNNAQETSICSLS